VLYAGGWVMLIAAAFYWIIDIRGARRWTFPFVVVGMNSIVMYLLAAFAGGGLHQLLTIFFGWLSFYSMYLPILESLVVLFIFWLVCLWLYRWRIFVRI